MHRRSRSPTPTATPVAGAFYIVAVRVVPRMNTWGQSLCPGLANRAMVRRDGRPRGPETVSDDGYGGGPRRCRLPGMGLESSRRRFRKSSAGIAPCS